MSAGRRLTWESQVSLRLITPLLLALLCEACAISLIVRPEDLYCMFHGGSYLMYLVR
jgi:hypothetical protein